MKKKQIVVSKYTCPRCAREYSLSGVKLVIGDKGVCVSKECALSGVPKFVITKVTYTKI